MGTKIKIETTLLNGTRVGHIVDNVALDSNETLKEAVDNGYVIGTPEIVKAQAAGVLKAMLRGIQRDGNGRKIDGIVSLQPYAKGSLADPTDNITKDRIGAIVRARMLKDFRVDTKDWSFIVEGANGTLRVTVITTGEEEGVIVLGEDTQLNGMQLTMGEGDSIGYEIPESGVTGVIAREHVTGEETRITVAAAALAELASDPANNGRDIVFTVRIGNKKAVKSAKMVIA